MTPSNGYGGESECLLFLLNFFHASIEFNESNNEKPTLKWFSCTVERIQTTGALQWQCIGNVVVDVVILATIEFHLIKHPANSQIEKTWMKLCHFFSFFAWIENFSVYVGFTLCISRSHHSSCHSFCRLARSLTWFNVFDDKTKIKTLLFVYIITKSCTLRSVQCCLRVRCTSNVKAIEVWLCPVNL